MLDQKDIQQIISQLPFQVKASSFDMVGEMVCFVLIFSIESKNIQFDVKLSPWYPLHFMGREGISFSNNKLKEFAHIMEDGSLCLHSSANQNPKLKLKEDIQQLYNWILKYYISEEKDSHYEDIVVNESKIDNCYISYAIPLSERPNLENDFGLAHFKPLSSSILHEEPCANYLIYRFQDISSKVNATNFHLSSVYRTSGRNDSIAPYILLSKHPSIFGKFAIESIESLSSLMTQKQLKFIYDVLSRAPKGTQFVPIFIGFPTVDSQIGWLSLMIDVDDIPWHGEAEKINGIKTGRWISVPNKNVKTIYAKTEVLTPELYYGRGCFPEILTASKILILGTGAIGSILAKTLVKCGCRNISLYDFDTKSYGNCCRSEYEFYRGCSDKQSELSLQLITSDPFVEVSTLSHNFDLAVKASFIKGDFESLKSCFDKYDYIFDCTTDDDLAYILDQIQEIGQIINISISNHAKELVCGFSPNIYDFLKFTFSKIVTREESNDLYNPSGCWNPTFKASYNDINSMLQYAIKRIARMITMEEPKHNFILRDSDEGLRIERV